MNYYAGIDVSLKESSVCIVDAQGKVVREAKVASEPEDLIEWFSSFGFELERIGLEAGPPVAMAFCGAEESGFLRRSAGDATCARRLQGNAGEERSQ